MTMTRFFLATSLGCGLFAAAVLPWGLTTVCGYSSGIALVGNDDGPEIVTVPYHQVLCKGDIFMKVEPIPGRTDAVNLKVRSGFSEWPDKEWIQERKGTVELTTESSRFVIRFGQMYPADNAVAKLTLSVRWFGRFSQ